MQHLVVYIIILFNMIIYYFILYIYNNTNLSYYNLYNIYVVDIILVYY